MNRTFLIFLMVGTALLIAVIGGEQGSRLPGYMPWEIKVLDNGNTRVFGITLNKTRIQDANQILSSFPQTRLITSEQNNPGLYAVYDQVNMGGFIAQIELQYDLDEASMQQLANRARASDEGEYSVLREELELALLGSPVKSIHYVPEIDYDPDMVLQHFGQPDEQLKLSDTRQLWRYRDTGLSILMDSQGAERFSYHAVTATPAEKVVSGNTDAESQTEKPGPSAPR